MEDLIAKLNRRLHGNIESKRTSKKTEILEGVITYKSPSRKFDTSSWISVGKNQETNGWDNFFDGKKKEKSKPNKSIKCHEEIRKLFPLKSVPIVENLSSYKMYSPEKSNTIFLTAKKSTNKIESTSVVASSEKHEKVIDEQNIQNIEENNDSGIEEEATFDDIVSNLSRIKEVANELSKHIPIYESPHHYKENLDYSNSYLKKEADSLRRSFNNQSNQFNRSFNNSVFQVEQESNSPKKTIQIQEKSHESLNNSIYQEKEVENLKSQKGFYYKLKCNNKAYVLKDSIEKTNESISYYADMNKNYLEMQRIKLDETERILSKQRIIL